LGSTHRSLLFRAMDFRSLELRLMVGALAGAVTGIALATAGAGPWALVGIELAQAVVSTVLMWALSRWRPSAAFSRASLRSLGPFGGRYVGASIFTTLNQNADNVLIGRYLGPSPLGLYTLAYSVILAPLSRIANPLQDVFYSGFSRLQEEPSAIASTWIRSTRLIAAASIPLTLGIAVTAPDAVPALFGERWRGAVPVVRILACVSLLQILQALHPAILGAVGRMRAYLRFAAASFAVNLAAFVIGLRWGIVGVAACFAGASVVLAMVLTALVARTLLITPRRILASLRGLWQPTAALIATTFLVRHVALREAVGPWGRIALVAVTGATAYLGVGVWSARDLATEARALLRRGWWTRPAT
jgi:O-antigen/teichoic acid export membrane protein